MKSKLFKHNHKLNQDGSNLRDTILGGQDGLVNVLGSVSGGFSIGKMPAMALLPDVKSMLKNHRRVPGMY